jgi:hypothetical protein
MINRRYVHMITHSMRQKYIEEFQTKKMNHFRYIKLFYLFRKKDKTKFILNINYLLNISINSHVYI